MSSRVTISNLFELIKSLKKEEKRYFKLFIKRYEQKGDSNYLILFQYIDKAKIYNKQTYKKHFKAISNLSALQSYLYQLIIRSLKDQHLKTSIDSQLLEGLIEIELLYKRDLISAAKAKLKEIKDLAELYQRIFIIEQ